MFNEQEITLSLTKSMASEIAILARRMQEQETNEANRWRNKKMPKIAEDYDKLAVKWLHLEWELQEFIEKF